MTALLSFAGVDAGYGRSAVVRNLDLRVDAGEIVSLLGPNGAGKTTTLMTGVGILPALKGTITFGRSPIRGGRPLANVRAGLGLLPEGRALFRSLSVKETLRLAARNGPITTASVLESFPQLAAILTRRTAFLSGGEQQMLALARLLVANPRMLMIDEMSLGLAPSVFGSILPVIRAFATDHGLGVLLVEQHADLALRYSDRAYVMVHGTVQTHGRSADLLDSGQLRSLYLQDGAPRATGALAPAANADSKEEDD